MAGAEFARGPNRSKVLDLDGYSDCNRNDQVSLFFFHISNLHKCISVIIHPMRAYRWNPSLTLYLVSQ